MQPAGMLPELDSLARVLEMQREREEEALELRLEMLEIISSVAEAYITAGHHITQEYAVSQKSGYYLQKHSAYMWSFS